ATAIGFTGGSLSYLPQFGILVYPWGNFAVFLYPIIMSYAILKHQLLDINVVIRKTLVYSLVTASLAAVYAGTVTILAFVVGSPDKFISVVSHPLDTVENAAGWIAAQMRAQFSSACLLISAMSLICGVFVLSKGMRKSTNLVWFLLSLSVSVWALGLSGMVS